MFSPFEMENPFKSSFVNLYVPVLHQQVLQGLSGRGRRTGKPGTTSKNRCRGDKQVTYFD